MPNRISKKLWLGHVMKENLEVEGNLPGVVFTVAANQKEAIENIRTNIKTTAYWKEGKSFIRIRSVFPLLEVGATSVELLRTRELAACLLDGNIMETHGIANTAEVTELPAEGVTSKTQRKRRRRKAHAGGQ